MIRYRTYEGIGLLHGRYSTHRFAPHFHDEFSIAVILSGALEFKCAGDSHCVEPATISAVNPGEVHTGQPGAGAGWEYLHFFVPPGALAQLLPELQATPPDIRKRVIQDHIRTHFAVQIRLGDLAAAVGVSPYHFLRTFAQDTGLTPHGYQQQVRVSFGLQRLRQGVPSAEAANDAGYADQSHFIRALKRTYGITPSLVQRAA